MTKRRAIVRNPATVAAVMSNYIAGDALRVAGGFVFAAKRHSPLKPPRARIIFLASCLLLISQREPLRPLSRERRQRNHAERNTAKRLENDATRLKRGYLRGILLPAATWTGAFIICVYSLRYFCIEGTIFDTTKAPKDRHVFYMRNEVTSTATSIWQSTKPPRSLPSNRTTAPPIN